GLDRPQGDGDQDRARAGGQDPAEDRPAEPAELRIAMATTSTPETTAAQPILERPVPHIISHAIKGPHDGWTSWFTTTDHKKIGILYLYTVLVFFVLGGVEALLIRLQLGAPENTLVTPEIYNQLFTMHGTTMIFLVI